MRPYRLGAVAGSTMFAVALLLLAGCGGGAGAADAGPDDAAADSGPDGAGDDGLAPDDGMVEDDADTGPDWYAQVLCLFSSDCMSGGSCCDGFCANLRLDPRNCGKCGLACPTENPFCEGGSCGPAPCSGTCQPAELCCAGSCCGTDSICCLVNVPGGLDPPRCFSGLCPPGCPTCK